MISCGPCWPPVEKKAGGGAWDNSRQAVGLLAQLTCLGNASPFTDGRRCHRIYAVPPSLRISNRMTSA